MIMRQQVLSLRSIRLKTSTTMQNGTYKQLKCSPRKSNLLTATPFTAIVSVTFFNNKQKIQRSKWLQVTYTKKSAGQ